MKNIVIIVLIINTITGCHQHSDKKKLQSIMTPPSFKLLLLDSSHFISSESLAKGRPIIFIYFNTDCEICQKETQSILSHMDQLKHTTIYWISGEPMEAITSFHTAHRFDTIGTAFVVKDYNYSFYHAYTPTSVPFIAIYNSNKQLVKIYKGKTDVNSIISNIDN